MNPATTRRQFLRASGMGLALPFLPSLVGAAATQATPKRMVLINASMGLLPKEFFPEGEGRDYEASPYLKPFENLRDRLTIFSGMSHPEVDGGHHLPYVQQGLSTVWQGLGNCCISDGTHTTRGIGRGGYLHGYSDLTL